MSCAICQSAASARYRCCSNEQHDFCESCCANIVGSLVANGKIALLFNLKVPCYVCNGRFRPDRFPASVQSELQHILSTIPTASTSPESIEAFNYGYNQSGELRHCVTQRKFVFLTQRHYERLGKAVEMHIQSLMKSDSWQYEEMWLPTHNQPEKVNIFVSSDFRSNANGCLVLIQGCGAVRPGLWSRACCINESLTVGAMFPYMIQAKQRNFSVIILNPNQTHHVDNEASSTEDLRAFYLSAKPLPQPGTRPIPSLCTSREHLLYVYDHVLSNLCPARRLCYVAHSAGGHHLMHLLRERRESVLSQPSKVAFIDSLHSLSPSDTDELKRFLKHHAMHFVASDAPLGKTVHRSESPICPEVSAGHVKHEYTSSACVHRVFDFFSS